MPPPKRRAAPRSAGAIAEDLAIARGTGGLRRASADDLAATIEWLRFVGMDDDEDEIARARDLLLHYVDRVADNFTNRAPTTDKTGLVAARSLEQLLLRPVTDDRLVQVVRRDLALDAGHAVSADAIRHREDRLLREVAEQVAADLSERRQEVPQTVEAAVHVLAPIAIDLRQQLHDGLCLIYSEIPPADPREGRIVDWFYETTVIELGDLLLGATHLEQAGLRQANLSRVEFALVNFGRRMAYRLFEEADDRARMLEFVQEDAEGTPAERSERLRGHQELQPLYERWRAWIGACYSTCAFERTTDVGYMCSPHAFLTLLYDFEIAYLAFGYTPPSIPDNEPLRHHALSIIDSYQV